MMPTQQVIKIFEYALNQEQTGLSFFRQSLERMGVGAAVTAFQRLIKEEEGHVAFISGILKKLKANDQIDLAEVTSMALEPTNYFDERARAEFLDKCIEGSMIPDVTVFNTAWLIEKDLSEFYANMANKVDGEPKKALEMLSQWEMEHEKFFRDFRDRLSETYANMPWGG